MQVRKAVELKKEWGDKPCDHPDFTKEYDLGAQTGDFICTQCGDVFTRKEKEDIEAKRERA